jgi:hypothetical protein
MSQKKVLRLSQQRRVLGTKDIINKPNTFTQLTNEYTFDNAVLMEVLKRSLLESTSYTMIKVLMDILNLTDAEIKFLFLGTWSAGCWSPILKLLKYIKDNRPLTQDGKSLINFIILNDNQKVNSTFLLFQKPIDKKSMMQCLMIINDNLDEEERNSLLKNHHSSEWTQIILTSRLPCDVNCISQKVIENIFSQMLRDIISLLSLSPLWKPDVVDCLSACFRSYNRHYIIGIIDNPVFKMNDMCNIYSLFTRWIYKTHPDPLYGLDYLFSKYNVKNIPPSYHIPNIKPCEYIQYEHLCYCITKLSKSVEPHFIHKILDYHKKDCANYPSKKSSLIRQTIHLAIQRGANINNITHHIKNLLWNKFGKYIYLICYQHLVVDLYGVICQSFLLQ